MNATPYIYTIDIPAYTHHAETITLDSGYAERLIQIRAGKAAHVSLICSGIDIAGSLVLDICMEHPESQIIVGISCTVRGTDQCIIRSIQRHEAPRAVSRLYVRKIVYDNAKAIYNGLIHIAHHAEGTVVSQNDKTFLDQLNASAESVPAIEVLNDDVACAHGSAIGSIDAELLWYIQSRGITCDQAKQLCYAAFLDEVRIAVFE